jgi:probable F420-dependent oxidoreductase
MDCSSLSSRRATEMAEADGIEIGVVFPQTEMPCDPAEIQRYSTAVEELGYTHIVVYDHVLGADRSVHESFTGPYDVSTTFHEPMVLFGYLAGVCSLELVTGVLILPQRQTALVAKQAAEIDLLCRGRFRLGIGIGWNAVEYEALGRSFTDRGRRMDEQVSLLRRLWTEQTVTHLGATETVVGAGLAPLPLQRPIPLWFGGSSPPAYRRAGRLGDGWMPDGPGPGPELSEAKRIVDRAAEDAGRDPASIGLEGRISLGAGGALRISAHEVEPRVQAWRDAGASHVAINTMNAGFRSLSDHIELLTNVASALGLGRRPASS